MKRAVNVVLSVFLAFLLLLPSVFTVHAALRVTTIKVASDSNQITESGYFRYDADHETWMTGLQSGDDWNIAYDKTTNHLTLRNLVIKNTQLFQTEQHTDYQDANIDPRSAPEAQPNKNVSLFGAIGLSVESYDPMIIELQGSNSITLSNSVYNGQIASVIYGMTIAGKKTALITIQGSGSLTVNCTSTNSDAPNFPLVSSFGVYNSAGMIDMESGTLDLNAEGIYCGIGLAAFGTDGTDLPAGTGEDWLHSLKMSGGSLTAKGTGDSTENPPAAMKNIIGVGTGISASRAISALGGSINAIGRGANRAFGINLFSGMEMSGGDVIADAALMNGYTIQYPFAITAHHFSQAKLPFSPALSITSPMSILEARNADGEIIADPVAFDHDDGTAHTYVIGPIDGDADELAEYAHIGIPAAVPTAAAATAASSWVPSYEVRFLDCSGRLISDQWVEEGQPAAIPQGFTYKEEELSWIYRSLTVSPVSCKYSGYVVPNTADCG